MPDEIDKIEDLVITIIRDVVDVWKGGEGNLLVEIRNDTGIKKAKLSKTKVERV